MRRDALEAIDPSWCPARPVARQRCYRLCRGLIEAGAPLPGRGGATVQGEDLGAWVQAQRLGWDRLLPARKHVEEVDGVPHKLGMFVGNGRRRAGRLSAGRRAEPDALGMRW
jgi:hypothetical protein